MTLLRKFTDIYFDAYMSLTFWANEINSTEGDIYNGLNSACPDNFSDFNEFYGSL